MTSNYVTKYISCNYTLLVCYTYTIYSHTYISQILYWFLYKTLLSLCSIYTRSNHTLNHIQVVRFVLQGDHWDKWGGANDGNLANLQFRRYRASYQVPCFFLACQQSPCFQGVVEKMLVFGVCNSPKKQQFLFLLQTFCVERIRWFTRRNSLRHFFGVSANSLGP